MSNIVPTSAYVTMDRPTHVSHPNITKLTQSMPDHLKHYAGASWREEFAWEMCRHWMANPLATESELKSAVHRSQGSDLSPEDIRAANPGMR